MHTVYICTNHKQHKRTAAQTETPPIYSIGSKNNTNTNTKELMAAQAMDMCREQQPAAPKHTAAYDMSVTLPAAALSPSTTEQQRRSDGARRERCPRCASYDTKFCYYNNYNTAQPRHFCRACRRYWTLGGSLRNVPIGGSTRKRPRPARSNRLVAAAMSSLPAPMPPPPPATTTQASLLGSLLASPLLALGAAPLLEGRLGLGLGSGAAHEPVDELALGFGFRGGGPLLWPSSFFEGDGHADTWKMGSGGGGVWQEIAGGGGGGFHGAQLL